MRRFIIIAVVALAMVGSFYGGMAYARSRRPGGAFARGDFAQFRDAGTVRGGGPGDRRGDPGTAGEIIAKDDKSITVKLRDGGSRIVFLSDTTGVTTMATTTLADVVVGKNVFVSGKNNSDGSITAETIQVR